MIQSAQPFEHYPHLRFSSLKIHSFDKHEELLRNTPNRSIAATSATTDGISLYDQLWTIPASAQYH